MFGICLKQNVSPIMIGPGMVPKIFSVTISTANPREVSSGSTVSVIISRDGFVGKKKRIIMMERMTRK